MANFNTHITVAAAASGLMSVLCLQVGLVTNQEAVLLALSGTIGGILPDVDLQRSYPSRIMFSLIATLTAFAMVFSMENDLSIVELWIVGLTTFFVVRYPIWVIFHEYSTHRGSIHSITAALAATFVTAALAYHWLGHTPFTSWMIASFMLFGFLIHLILDEIYSVDFSNRRIKRSFGTALKLLDSRKPVKATALALLTLMAWYAAPSSQVFWDTFTSQQTYQIIGSRMFPDNFEHLKLFSASTR